MCIRDRLHGLWGASNPGKPVLLCGHMDTVFPPGTGTPFSIRDGTVRGPGALDMKAGLVIALYTIRALQSAGYDQRPIRVVFPGDEELVRGLAPPAEELALRRSAAADIRRAVGAMKEPYRQVCRLCLLEEQSPEEAALALGRPVKTVYTQLSRGKKMLREALERSGRHGIP